jgi:arylsulfatase A-like enzyme
MKTRDEYKMGQKLKPNILLLFTDQQRFDTIAALGNEIIKTPAMDRLVAEGTAFTRAYTPSPVCIPGRCCMVTGQPAHRTGCADNGAMPQNFSSFMEHLHDAGYQTHGTGKMHFEPDPFRLWGFESRDIAEEVLQNGNDYYAYLQESGYGHVTEDGGLRSEYYYIPQPSQLPPKHHQSTWVADRSIDFLKTRDTSRPFFLWSSWVKPHPPFESPVPWSKLYRPEESGYPYAPENSEELLCIWNRIQNRYKWRDNGWDGNLMRTMRAAYMACVSFVDYNIGRVLDALGEELDNTLVILSSDHGELLGDYGSVGKRTMLDPSVRVPLLVRYPENFKAGAQCDTPVSLLDLWPTFLAAAGVETDAYGTDLAQIAAGEQKDRAVISQFQQKHLGLYMLAKRDLKYVYSSYDRKEWLFDISGDPMKIDGPEVSADPAFFQYLEKMRHQLTQTLENEGAGEAVENGQWKKYPQPDLGLSNPDFGLIYQDDPEGGELLQQRINALPKEYHRKVWRKGRAAVELIADTVDLTK